MTEPFSPPGYAPPLRARDDSLTAPIIVYVLYVVTIPTIGFSALIGLIMAYVLRADAGPMAQSHYTFQIRTFWLHLLLFPLGLLLILLGVPLLIVVIGLPMIMLGGLMIAGAHLWYLVRCIVGLIVAADGRPYADPRTWLL